MAKHLLKELNKARVGARLALLRRIANKRQEDFAAAAGLSRTAYNQYETGAKMPSVEAATRLCETYDLTLDYIYHGDMSGLRQRTIEAINALQAVD